MQYMGQVPCCGGFLCSFLRTVSSVNGMSVMHSLVLCWKSGMVDISSSTNTDLKKSPRTSAVSWSMLVNALSSFIQLICCHLYLLLGFQVCVELLWLFLEIVDS